MDYLAQAGSTFWTDAYPYARVEGPVRCRSWRLK